MLKATSCTAKFRDVDSSNQGRDLHRPRGHPRLGADQAGPQAEQDRHLGLLLRKLYTGVITTFRGRNRVDTFTIQDIPYAEPPLGDLRFRPPVPVTRGWGCLRDARQTEDKVNSL